MSILETLEKDGGEALAAARDAAKAVAQIATKEGGAIFAKIEEDIKTEPRPTPQQLGCSKDGKLCL